MGEDLAYVMLFDLYAPLLTERQRKIADLHFNYDLSLGEIAEQTSVSRQSVYDCLQTIKNTLTATEEKLGFYKALSMRQAAFERYCQEEDALLKEAFGKTGADFKAKLSKLRADVNAEV
ncbi:MAG: hypothetical protein IJY11_00445 [Clostridia bacterium]|nr:hypothetical protein [Clostridia bacterium]